MQVGAMADDFRRYHFIPKQTRKMDEDRDRITIRIGIGHEITRRYKKRRRYFGQPST
jgi:hypothetical protein